MSPGTCAIKVPIEDFELDVPLLNIHIDPVSPEDLEIHEVFEAEEVGACCEEGAGNEAITTTALYDCAAKACLDANDALYEQYISSEIGLTLAKGEDSDVLLALAQNSRDSALHYAQALSDIDEFEQCTNQLIANGSYMLSNAAV
ncbi:MAG TPA: hypothetical protein ENJ18_18015, partial [Nannocystis exedens]|nr:hypothetical protein [Nannocystis exedens]